MVQAKRGRATQQGEQLEAFCPSDDKITVQAVYLRDLDDGGHGLLICLDGDPGLECLAENAI